MQKEKFKILIQNSIILLNFAFLILIVEFLVGCYMPGIIVPGDPLTPEEHINLGVAYEKKGEFDNALKEYKEASKKLPMAYLYIGNIYFQKKELEGAERYYRKAIKEESDNADAYNNLAWLYYTKRENLDEAERLATKAMELNPSNDVYKDTLDKIRELRGLHQ